MSMTICKIFRFDSAHWLPNYQGKCANLHGHSWTLEVEIAGPIDPFTGMVMDFASLKEIVKDQVLEKLDHTCLNELVKNPTCENILKWALAKLETRLKYDDKLKLKRLRLWETPDSYAEINYGS